MILLLGDGMGMPVRTAARVLSRGYRHGKPNGRLAMDTMEATGLVMTSALNALITDSSPGMSSYVTGHKAANNMAGVYPDNTWPARGRGDQDTPREGLGLFDNPRTEYLGALLRRTRGPGFNVGIVTTSDLTDATPAANAVYSSNRLASEGIASRFLDERGLNGISVLMGGGLCHFVPRPASDAPCGRRDGRALEADFRRAGFTRVLDADGAEGPGNGREGAARAARPVPADGDERGVRQDRRRRLQRRAGGRRATTDARPADARGDDRRPRWPASRRIRRRAST